MKVIGIKHIVEDNNCLEVYSDKLKRALSEGVKELGNVDVAVGPDYALHFLKDKDRQLIDFELRKETLERLANLSNSFPNTLILPGTTPRNLREKVMIHTCPVFVNGHYVKDFQKETDCGDSDIAERNGLVYEKGDCSKNYISYNGKIISGSICSDHGHQRFPQEGVFLEAIMAFDDHAGFYARAGDLDERFGLVVNGRDGSVQCVKYNPFNKPKIAEVHPKCEDSDFCGFELSI